MPVFIRRSGFTLVYVLSIGITLLIVGGLFFRLVMRHHEEIRHVADAQTAVYLGEAGVGFAVCEVRKAFEEGNAGGAVSPLARLLLQPGSIAETSIVPYFDASWKYQLAACAAEVDPTASLQVDAWFTGFEAAETDPGAWNDPAARRGFLAVRATGSCRGVSRTVDIRRPIFAGNLLPPVTTKFTLRAHSSSQGLPGRFNTLSNDYDGHHVEGDRPLTLYNHSLPDDPLSPLPAQEIEPTDVFLNRGWVWLGGGPVRLHLTSGALDAGELFQLYAIPEPGKPKAIRFTTPAAMLPPGFDQVKNLPWDRPNGGPDRTTGYRFSHDFLLDGFHDRSSSLEHDAMYEGNLLSQTELKTYGAKASSLHLFGDCRKGYQSRTKVIGDVSTAFLRFGRLEVTPQEPDVAAIFNAVTPSPQYFLPSCEATAYNPDQSISEFLLRTVGGPLLKRGDLFPAWDSYAENMCRIVEFPTATLYNFMGQTSLPSDRRTYPPSASPLAFDEGSDLQLRRGGTLLYRGTVRAPRSLEVLRNRAMVELATVGEFWTRFYKPDERLLRLDSTVRIINNDREPFVFPPPGVAVPLNVEGTGLVIVERGNLVCRGNRVSAIHSSFTIVAPEAETVRFEQSDLHQLNLLAPRARLVLDSPCRIHGSVEVRDTLQSGGSKGGGIVWREIQDPTREAESGLDSRVFQRACLADIDGSWHE